MLELLRRSQHWSTEELRSHQAGALRALLEAARSVPFYRKRFTEAGIAPEDVRSVEDLAAIPPLERSELQSEGIAGLRVAGRRGRVIETSGSTGLPVEVLRPLELVRWIEAADLRAREWYGVGLVEPRLHVTSVRMSRRRRAASELANTRLFHLDRPDAARAVDLLTRELENRPPSLVSGAASALYVLALGLVARGCGVGAKAAWSGANVLFEHQRPAVESAFGCKVYDRYGAWEVGVIAHECPEGRSLHQFAESVIVEIVKQDGSPAAAGEMGEVLVTALHNTAMPIVRYRIGDLARAADGPCSCGVGLPVLGQLVGRANDVVCRSDGTYLTPQTITNTVMTRVRKSVVEFQVEQDEDLRLRVRVVQRDDPPPEPYRARIAATLDELVGLHGATTVERVAEIPLTGEGKLRHVVSRASVPQ